MKYIHETAEMIGISLSTLSQLIRVSFKEMSDMLEKKKEPTEDIINSCRIARQIFLKKNNTHCVRAKEREDEKY